MALSGPESRFAKNYPSDWRDRRQRVLKRDEHTCGFAVDISGFSTFRFGRYFDYKHGQEQKYRKWVKAHICCGVKTNIVTAVSLTEGKAGDSPEFGPLVKRTAEVFGIDEVSADKAYSSRENRPC